MSNEALTAVAKADIRPSGRKFVAMALADYADEAWSCFPSVEQLAQYTSQGEKTVRDHLDGLEESGVITRDRQRREDGTLGRYRFKLHRRNLPVANFARGEKRPEPPAKFATHNPQEEPLLSSLRSDSARKRTPRQELMVVLDEDHAKAVVDHRQRLRKPLTERAAQLLAGKLAQCADPNIAADEMIANGWQGFDQSWLAKRSSGGTGPPRRTNPVLDSAERLLAEMRAANGPDRTNPRYPERLALSVPDHRS